MTVTEIKEALEGLTEAQKKVFNQGCDSKIYDKSMPMISELDQAAAENLADEVNGISDANLDTLNGDLPSDLQLTKRPCN